jgi:3-deoxy-D-manno-octulosonic-acid transferase
MSRFLFFLYRLLIDLVYIIVSPFLAFLLPKAENKQRIGFHTPELHNCIWVHAASVGEVNACKALVGELLERYPQKEVLLTTTTVTGMRTAQKIDSRLHTHLLPLDIPLLMIKFIHKINPGIVILIETEIWPVMLYHVKKLEIPVIWINARISDKSYPKYKRMHLLWQIIQTGVTQINAQSELDAERFRGLGFRDVINAHNLKFALKLPFYERAAIRTEWMIAKKSFVLVFGSSRPGEEILLRDSLPHLYSAIPNLYVILVPRHLNRLDEIKALYADIPHELYSGNHVKTNLLIVDKMGILVEAYALADLAVIGGSFYDFGGHNPLEAAFYGLPIVMGSYYSSCRDSVTKLREGNAIRISDRNNFVKDIVELAHDENLRMRMGIAARAVMDQYAHSLEINIKSIEKWF